MNIVLLGGSGFIGFHTSKELLRRQHRVTVLDIVAPDPELNVNFTKCDVSDGNLIEELLGRLDADVIINFVARTDDEGAFVLDYAPNIVALSNILQSMASIEPKRPFLIHVSTQFVVGPRESPKSDRPKNPYTLYGESKAIAEELLQGSKITNWLIVRPSAVWGPRHPSFATSLLPLIARRWLLVPRGPALRSYIHVSYLAWKLAQLIDDDLAIIRGSVIYLGDPASDQKALLYQFSRLLTGHNVRRAPYWILAILSWPSLFPLLRRSWPLTRTRLEILSSDYLIPADSDSHFDYKPDRSLTEKSEEFISWYLELVNAP
jgi:nucleoside-diphosphate-sugar epimerase